MAGDTDKMSEAGVNKDWLRGHIPVALRLVPAFNVTCRTLRRRCRIAAHEEEDRMHKLVLSGRRRLFARAVAAASMVAIGSLALAGAVAPGMAFAARSGPAAPAAAVHHDGNVCHLGNGVKHVVQLTFDNVHFFRDNPNVPSDIEMMPNLLNFFEQNGTWMSNNHTPIIAHTAIDILSTLTGLYGDRQGMPGMNNAYRSYNPDG